LTVGIIRALGLMGVIDRSQEFLCILSQFGAEAGRTVEAKCDKNLPTTAQSELNNIAKDISDKVYAAALRVTELKKIVKATALFDDRTSHIQEMSFYINEDIRDLNQKISNFEKHVEHLHAAHADRRHSVNMVGILKLRLGEVIKDAKVAHEGWTASMQRQQMRKQQLPFVRRPLGKTFTDVGPTLSSHTDAQGGELRQRVVERVSKLEAVQKVQAQVAELGKMFTVAARHVNEHQDMIERIDDHTEESMMHIENANNELLHHWHHVAGSRQLICKVFGILFFFVVFFVVFLSD
jgi:syntaxin 5